MVQPTYRPFESTTTGMEKKRKEETRWMRPGMDSLPPLSKSHTGYEKGRTMLILKKRFGLVLAVLFLEACTPWRATYLEESVGKASQDDVTKRLGPPHLERSLADGSIVWTYQHRSAVLEGTDGKCAQYVLVFDKSMILHNWTRQGC